MGLGSLGCPFCCLRFLPENWGHDSIVFPHPWLLHGVLSQTCGNDPRLRMGGGDMGSFSAPQQQTSHESPGECPARARRWGSHPARLLSRGMCPPRSEMGRGGSITHPACWGPALILSLEDNVHLGGELSCVLHVQRGASCQVGSRS